MIYETVIDTPEPRRCFIDLIFEPSNGLCAEGVTDEVFGLHDAIQLEPANIAAAEIWGHMIPFVGISQWSDGCIQAQTVIEWPEPADRKSLEQLLDDFWPKSDWAVRYKIVGPHDEEWFSHIEALAETKYAFDPNSYAPLD